MPPRKRAIAEDSSSQDDDIDVGKMIKTKQELDKIRKDREEKRCKLQQSLDSRIDDLYKRIEQTVDKHTRRLTEINQQQLDQLKTAVAKRNDIEQLIRDKLAQVQRDGQNLAAMLDLAYEYRLSKAKSRAFTQLEHEQLEKASVQLAPPGEGQSS